MSDPSNELDLRTGIYFDYSNYKYNDISENLLCKTLSALNSQLRNININLSKNFLNSNHLVRVKSSLSGCTNLHRLNLAFQISIFKNPETTILSEAISARRSSLRELTLKLHDCSIGDTQLEILTKEISKCTLLTHLSINLEQCELSKAMNSMKSMFSCLQGLENVSLNLSACNLYTRDVLILAEGLKSIKSIKSLILKCNYNSFYKEGQVHLFEVIKGCPELKFVQIDMFECAENDEEDSEVVQAFAESISCNSNLKQLKISSAKSEIHAKGIHAICQGIVNSTSLTQISLNFLDTNSLTKSYFGWGELAKLLKAKPELESVEVQMRSPDKKSSEEFELFCFALQSHSINLQNLSLNLKNYSITCLASNICSALISRADSVQIIELNLFECEIDETSAEQLSNALLTMKRLKDCKLYFPSHLIESKGVVAIGAAIGGLTALSNILVDFGEYPVSFENIDSFFDQVSRSMSLTTVYFRITQPYLTSSNLESIQTRIMKLKNLIYLSIIHMLVTSQSIRRLKSLLPRLVSILLQKKT